MKSLSEWLAWQETLHPRTIDLGLERVRRVAQALGVTRIAAPLVVVGGTNGKGSCVALLEAIWRAAGHRVGAFTSPHLIDYRERIRIDGREIGEGQLVRAFERIDAARGAATLTFFEFNTLAALIAFAEADLDAVVLEVGLGGRLDAVNVVDPDVSLLVSVGLDHCEWLGATLDAIGREKAGIFRAGRPAVIGSLPIPQSVHESARDIGARLVMPGVDFESSSARDGRWSWRGTQASYDALPPPALLGRHQYDNAAAVLAVIEALQSRLPVQRAAIEAGLRDVELPGRFQRLGADVEWVLDVAHNPDAARRLGTTLADRPPRGRTIAIAGILKDKDAPAIVAALEESLRAGGARAVSEWLAVDLPGPRGGSGSELREIVGRHSDPAWSTAPGVVPACERAAASARAGDRVLVFGSFHTVGPALAWLRAADPPA
ncbi:MAG TPA: bifunctional tetrahydrofolate synthase/dihydrofolate synthase [Steroidobacteraceae bacterium]|nr:bifunctional tetrahydrofolate synthase/dihydrofolate synthase [Steroidobacteraceae bacterium]